jgi:flagellar basal-body rod protein FlgC
MDFFTALHVSGSGLSAERTRVNLASSNLANAETTRGPNGQPYQRLDPVFQAVAMDGTGGKPSVPGGEQAVGVEVAKVVADGTPGKRVYSPGHPDADADGFVTFPNVNRAGPRRPAPAARAPSPASCRRRWARWTSCRWTPITRPRWWPRAAAICTR